jgi:hypothetical protein
VNFSNAAREEKDRGEERRGEREVVNMPEICVGRSENSCFIDHK